MVIPSLSCEKRTEIKNINFLEDLLMKKLLHKEYDKHTSITISSHEQGRISSLVYAGDGGWVDQYTDKSFEEVCSLQRKKILKKIEDNACTKNSLKLLLNFNQTELF